MSSPPMGDEAGPPSPRLEIGARCDVEVIDVGRHLDGTASVGPSTLFIPGTVPGDRVLVEIDKRFRRGWRARVVEWVRRSADRAEPRCPHFGACAGCQFQHLAYPAQLTLKLRELSRTFAAASVAAEKVLRTPVPSPVAYGYRNRITLHGPGGYGFWRIGGRRILEIDQCPICAPAIEEALSRLRLPGATDALAGVPNLLLRASSTGDMFVGSESGTTADTEWIREELHEDRGRLQLHLRVDPRAFWQGNTALLPAFVRLVRDAALEPEPECVLDLYCGVGVFSLAAAAAAELKRVVGVDSNSGAIASAEASAALLRNGRRCMYLQAPAEERGPELLRKIDPARTSLVVDPPRSGIPTPLLIAILDAAPQRIVYVSCNANALARDLRVLLGIEHGITSPYRIGDITPVDLFPQTRHLETITTLTTTTGSDLEFST